METKEIKMETKEIKIDVPEGYEIDKENSVVDPEKNTICIKFNPIPKKSKFSDYDGSFKIKGFYIDDTFSTIESICDVYNDKDTKNLFATEKQLKSALAMAQISQIMINDERFGGPITEDEWDEADMKKYCIKRTGHTWYGDVVFSSYYFLAFHNAEQRTLFIRENLQLVKDYLMID